MMLTKFALCLSISLIQEIFLVQADVTCQYYNQTAIATMNCNDQCCSAVAMSPQAACCASITWSSLAAPIFVVSTVCLMIICLMFFRPILKLCLCGHKCPCGSRSRVVATTGAASIHNNPSYAMNNGDLPDYEAVAKDSPMKDMTPPPYNFVAAHPTDFGIGTRILSAPPQYRSRSNSVAVDEPPPVAS